MTKSLLITTVLALLTAQAQAQTDDEYLLETGAGVGTVSYLGDYNGNPLKDMRPMATIMLRRVINPYMALRLGVSAGKLAGNSADTDTWYPGTQTTAYKFSNTLADMSLTYEYNFMPYGTGQDYRGAKRLTPFIMIGVGATYVKTDKSTFTANIPIGVGVKYKIGRRLNLGLEWAMHFSLSDKLDGAKDPYTVKSSGIFKNTDGYSALQLTLTYSFMPKCTTCNKDE